VTKIIVTVQNNGVSEKNSKGSYLDKDLFPKAKKDFKKL
jgi:hypothetical protein